MKKVFAVLFVAVVFSACGGGSKSGSADSAATTTAPADSSAATTARSIDTTKVGGKLIAKNDCLACHKIDTKIIGPKYADVAAKYPATDANIDTLANKVLKGGKGQWGDIAMAPHPALSLSDAKEMVKYILSLKK